MKKAQQQHIFERWLSEHQGLLFKVVRAYAFNDHDREDLFQEISLQIWDSIPNFKQQSAVTTWMYRVALYSAMAWSKKERKHQDKKQPLHTSEHVLSSNVSQAKDPRLDWLYEQIANLDEIERSLTLLLLDGFSYREMSKALGISESNVGVKINRIKKHLASKSFEDR